MLTYPPVGVVPGRAVLPVKHILRVFTHQITSNPCGLRATVGPATPVLGAYNGGKHANNIFFLYVWGLKKNCTCKTCDQIIKRLDVSCPLTLLAWGDLWQSHSPPGCVCCPGIHGENMTPWRRRWWWVGCRLCWWLVCPLYCHIYWADDGDMVFSELMMVIWSLLSWSIKCFCYWADYCELISKPVKSHGMLY